MSLKIKRLFDIVVASIMLMFLAVPMLVIAVCIKLDSRGPVFFRQEKSYTVWKDILHIQVPYYGC